MKSQNGNQSEPAAAPEPIEGMRKNVVLSSGIVQARMDLGTEMKRELLTAAMVTGSSVNDLVAAVLRETRGTWLQLWSGDLARKIEAARTRPEPGKRAAG